MTGTWINIAAVLIGGGLGTLLGSRLPERIRETVLHGVGLVTLMVGIHLTLKTQNTLIVLGSVLLGGLLGEWWRLEARLEALSNRLRDRMAKRLSARNVQ
ncbi:MAG: DUF554 family protein, partial [Chloroflexi bacterium]|nr:DUF554 family protein [Chloroflexota bacterium]